VTGILELDGVWAGYGGSDVLRDLTFSVPEGGVTCVVGPNGAGKSTVLRVVSGQLVPRRGSVMFAGERLNGWSPRDILRKGIVQVAQNHTLFPDMSVRDNVEMGGYLIRDRVEVAKRLDRIRQIFPIVTDRGHDKAGALSGGQQRLVEFARCLMLDPRMVVLDEPSMGLDPKTLRTVLKQVETMWRDGRTILLVEQNVRAGLSLATHAVVVESGTVRLQGPGREIVDNPEIARLYLGGGTAAVSARE
jgi:ABC-type branched-subunit amino acid transport system ATPase component